ncbi:hypothetical protein, partial [Kitasatospora nipponensis]|uniref:hypothetical protein n=1 Tax=Kitasatospora nipponensis TaxID=258049 RepID=UPI0031D97004
SNPPTPPARAAARHHRVGRGLAPAGAGVPRGSAPGSARHTLRTLGTVALAAEVALALVGALPAAGSGLALFGAAALLIARYVSGAAAEDSGYRRSVRLMGSRAPALGEWYWTVRNGLDENGYPHPLRPQLQRLYAARLSERHGLSLYTEQAKAAAVIGPQAWPWIDPDHAAPGVTVAPKTLRILVDRLETL